MEFQTIIEHTAENENGLATFLNFVESNYATVVHSAHAYSSDFTCGCILVFASLTDVINAVTNFKSQFNIKYQMVMNK